MSKLIQIFMFGKDIEIDEREQKTSYEILAKSGILAFIICLCSIVYDLFINKTITPLGSLALIIILIMTYYILIMMKVKKLYIRYKKNNKILLRNSILSGFIFFSLFTLFECLSGKTINTLTLVGTSVAGIVFGLCMYSWSKYNHKKLQDQEL
ncbi:hypothetical protein [Bacillus toyonensis]|uniref:hypothetical protein n=1 Tax=Bacillus toyonensis TaxID=155322 RepID=UPI000BF64D7D|nr:hypothetical protein [Bacillus toyonensis]PGA41626.1 hypothetical protein COL85_25695 [Bacillus toyonensis]